MFSKAETSIRGGRRFSSAVSGQRSHQTRFLSFEESRSYMRTIGLKSWEEWLTWSALGERPGNIPSNPRSFYLGHSNWNGFPDWLGYEMRAAPAHQKRMRIAPNRTNPLLLRHQWDSAKEHFLEKVPKTQFQFRALPHRSLAQFAFRPAGGGESDGIRSWASLVLRSAHRPHRGRIFFEIPRDLQGSGIFFIVTDSKRLFFFSREFLDAHSNHGVSDKRRRPVNVRIADIDEHEVVDADQMRGILNLCRRRSPLLCEEELSSPRMFSMQRDAERHSLMQQAVNFLRGDCELQIERPSLRSFDAHFVYGKKNIIGRTCRCDAFYSRLQWCDRKGPGYPVRSKEGEEGADFVLGLIRREGCNEPPQLRGFFVFPTNYLLSLEYIRQPATKSPWGRSQMMVYPPWVTPKRADTRQRQKEQLDFFVDVSSEEGLHVAAAKAREILI